jgi:hypothetical protein
MILVQLSTKVDDYLLNVYNDEINYCRWNLTKGTSLIIGSQYIKIHTHTRDDELKRKKTGRMTRITNRLDANSLQWKEDWWDEND